MVNFFTLNESWLRPDLAEARLGDRLCLRFNCFVASDAIMEKEQEGSSRLFGMPVKLVSISISISVSISGDNKKSTLGVDNKISTNTNLWDGHGQD